MNSTLRSTAATPATLLRLALATILAILVSAKPCAQPLGFKLENPDEGEPSYALGTALAMDGDLLVASAPWASVEGVPQSGVVYVYRLGVNGEWLIEATLPCPNLQDYSYYGASVAVHGDRILVGDPYPSVGERRSGTVYVYRRMDTDWMLEAELIPFGGGQPETFGSAVQIWEDTVAVSAPKEDVGGGVLGAVYIFRRAGGDWVPEAKLVSSEQVPDASFGDSIALHGNNLLVGLRTRGGLMFERNGNFWGFTNLLASENPGDSYQSGVSVVLTSDTAIVLGMYQAAHVFRQEGANWIYDGNLQPSGLQSMELPYRSVALHGDFVAIGSRRQFSNGFLYVNTGAAYVFARSTSGWNQYAILTGLGEREADDFSFSLAASDRGLVVGAPFYQGAGTLGAVSWFRFEDNSLDQGTPLTISEAAGGDLFGSVAAISGDTAMVGVPEDQEAGVQKSGSVRVFRRDGSIWEYSQALLPTPGFDSAYFGRSVAINDDVAVVGQYYFGGYEGGGAATVFERKGGAWIATQTLLSPNAPSDDGFGRVVSISGDLIAVSASSDDDVIRDSGAVHLFRRTVDGWIHEAKLKAEEPFLFGAFGSAVSVHGNRVIVGDRKGDYSSVSSAAYIFEYTQNGWSQAAELNPSNRFGSAVSLSGDVAAVGMTGNPNYLNRLYIYRRLAGEWVEGPHITFPNSGGGFANRFAVHGDVVVATSREDGRTVLRFFQLKGGAWELVRSIADPVPGDSSSFGSALAMEGNRIMIGAPRLSDPERESGAAYIYSFDFTPATVDGLTVH
ncbi:MAG: hypothetical protein SF028_03755 [Candidatus Sumerlaeia bacterium]|nr:hypothetical protein [Candidatus Sumerlaeia bacterium]